MTSRKIRKVKRKLKKEARFLLVIFLFVCIVGASYYGINKLSVLISSKDVEEGKDEEVVEVKQPKEYRARLFMVGDALIHTGVYYDAKQSDGTYDFKPMLEYVKPISSKYDIKYYNQETILGGIELGLSSYPRFNSPYEVGDAFIDAGFNLVSLATNHTMDKGEQGVINSVNYWNSKIGIVTSGQCLSQEERDNVQTYEINGITYAFFSYTTWTNGLETPVGKEYLNNVYSEEKARLDIEKVRDKVDVVIVAMHWGIEYSLGVSQAQENIANYLSSLGVDLIIGAHPHVVEPVEYINEGRTLVVYSLGNFISDQIGVERLTGLMMEVTIKKIVDIYDYVTVTVENPKAELIYTKSNSYGKKNFKVYPYPMLTDDILPNYLSYYEKFKAVVNSRYPNLTWGVTGE